MAQVKATRRVLILYEAGPSYPVVDLINQGLKATLGNSRHRIEFYREYMETALFPSPADQQLMRDHYIHKYRNHMPDVIITVGPSPLQFMVEAHKAYFPGVPIIFCLPSRQLGSLIDDPEFTGVESDTSPAETLEAALRLLPGTKHLFVVGGTSPFDRQQQAIVSERLKPYESRLDISYLTEFSMPELLERVKRLPSQAIILLAALGKDGAGTLFTSTESGPMIIAAANTPVFTLSDRAFNHGEVGGKVASALDQGKIAGAMAVRILNGEQPRDIPRVESASIYMFDWRALKHWHLSESRLPPGSIVLNRQLTVWESYGPYIVGGIALLLAETLLIIWLGWERERRRKSEEYSREIVLRSPVAMAVTRGQEQKNELVNYKFTEVFGYTLEDVPDEASWWRIAYPDEVYREGVKAEWREHVKKALSNKTAIDPMQATVRCKDGSSRDIEFHFAAIGDASLVKFVDVTDRERALAQVRESEERFRVMANTAPVHIWMSGTDKLCTYVNKPWLDFKGRSLAAELGNGWTEGIHSEDIELAFNTYTSAFDRREPFEMQYRMRRRDGQYRWLYDIGVPRFNADNSFAGYIGSVVDVTDRKMVEDALANLSGQLIEAQEEERRRIARELHDDYNQRLAMLAIDLEKIAGNVGEFSSETADQLYGLFDRVSELGADLHSLSHSLHSSTLESLGLVAGIKAFCREFAEQQGVQVDFTCENVPRAVPSDAALCLFRTAQEALRNFKKHSGAARAEVRLEFSGEKLHLSIADAGKGFDPNNHSGRTGIGLRSIEERLRVLGGHLDIHSLPMRGAKIEVWVPLQIARQRAS